MSLNRTRADWPIVAAAWLITVLAATLLAAGAIYPSAASEAGLRRALVDAPAEDVNIRVSLYAPSADGAAIQDHVQPLLDQVIAPLGGSIVRDWQGSATLPLPAIPGAEAKAGDQAVVGFLERLPDHATLVAGDWPADASTSQGTLQLVVLDAVARQLHLAVGDALSFVARPQNEPVVVKAQLVGIFSINALSDPFWNSDPQLLTGTRQNSSFTTFGPFLTTESDLLLHAGVASVHLQWRIAPDFARLTVEDAGPFRGRVEALADRLRAATGDVFVISTGLPAILGDAERSLLVSRTGVLLLMAQLAILAAYAIVLTAALLVDHRRIDTALLRSRGAGTRQVAALALAEGLLCAIPAVLVAPWLAVAALNMLNVAGPLADVGLHINPRVTLDGYVAAGAAGLVCVALLVLPAALAARGFAAEQGGRSRQETRTFGQRMGVDVALLAVTGIALWQLRLYGAPLTRTVQGTLGLDPLLVAAPAIGLIAGGVLALRILPLLAQAVETAVSRGRGLVLSLGSRQMARRPLRYTRSALLLMLAMSMGVFALSYAATWSSSQRDQADYQSGADVRVLPGTSLTKLPGWALPSAYNRLAGVRAASPIERISNGVVFAAAGNADLLALDSDTAAGIALFRPDAASEPLAAQLQRLTAGRPTPALIALPDGTTALRILPHIDISAVDHLAFGIDNAEPRIEPLDPSQLASVRVSAIAIVRDAHGLLYRVESGVVPLALQPPALILPLQPTTEASAAAVTQAGARLDGPIELAEIGVALWLPVNTEMTRGLIGVAAVSAGAGAAGPWEDVAPASLAGWKAKIGQGLQLLRDVPAEETEGTTVRLSGAGALGGLFGSGGNGPSAQVAFLPTDVAPGEAALPAIANRAFLAALALGVGDTFSATVEGRIGRLAIAGVVDSFPTTDPSRPLLILDESTLGLLRLEGLGNARNPDEWWLAATDGDAESVSAVVLKAPFDSAAVVTAIDRTRGLSTDPVALGIIGALLLGFVATGLFAIVGLTVSAAVSARQRRTEFALLRALGLSGGQLSGSLWLENGSLVLVSLLAGTGLGLLIGWLVLPFVTVTQRAAAPVPPVLVEVPWDRILLLDLGSALALGVAVIVIGTVLRRLGVGSVLRMGED